MPDVSASGAASEIDGGHAAISDVVGIKEQTLLEKLISSQSFWVTVALLIIVALMSYLQPRAFASTENFYNITRNFAFIGIMSMGMVAVIITGGIDLSVGSLMGLVGVVCGVGLYSLEHASAAGNRAVTRQLTLIDETAAMSAFQYQKGLVAEYLVTGDPTRLAELDASRPAFEAWLARMSLLDPRTGRLLPPPPGLLRALAALPGGDP